MKNIQTEHGNKIVIGLGMRYIYLSILVIGTTYLVGWCGWSKWTYLFMILLVNF